ncbi:MAG: hypothetical protein ABI435_04810 [Pseudolysinimonas sp.]
MAVMQYFQKVRLIQSGMPTLSGVFRRPTPADYRSDERYNFLSRSWQRTLNLQHILTGLRDGEVVEVPEEDIRVFLASKLPPESVDSVLASPPHPPVGTAELRSSRFRH